jgi:hypothetical protein
MSSVWVRNTSDDALKDGYNGEFYEFAPGTEIEVPDYIATHVFGYGRDDKYEYLVRLGWTRTHADLPDAYARLEKFVISGRPTQNHHLTSPVVGQVSPPPLRRGRERAALRTV